MKSSTKTISLLSALVLVLLFAVWRVTSSTRSNVPSDNAPHFDDTQSAERYALRALSAELKRRPKAKDIKIRWQILRRIEGAKSYGDSSIVYHRPERYLQTFFFHEPDPTSLQFTFKPPFFKRVQTIFSLYNAPSAFVSEAAIHNAAVKNLEVGAWCMGISITNKSLGEPPIASTRN